MTAPKRFKTTNLRDPIRGDALDPVTGLLPAAATRTMTAKHTPATPLRMRVWHFAADKLHDGSTLPQPGYAAPEISNPVPCERGYHGSERLYDALQYAPGTNLCQRELGGTIIPHGNPVDKLCASTYTQVTPYVDVRDLLVRFARHCALLALRVDAPAALRVAGLHQHADKLAALPDDCDLTAAETAARAAWAARAAARAARAAAGAAAGDVAWAAAGAAWAARETDLEAWLLRELEEDA